jgi:hypothetical protein
VPGGGPLQRRTERPPTRVERIEAIADDPRNQVVRGEPEAGVRQRHPLTDPDPFATPTGPPRPVPPVPQGTPEEIARGTAAQALAQERQRKIRSNEPLSEEEFISTDPTVLRQEAVREGDRRFKEAEARRQAQRDADAAERENLQEGRAAIGENFTVDDATADLMQKARRGEISLNDIMQNPNTPPAVKHAIRNDPALMQEIRQAGAAAKRTHVNIGRIEGRGPGSEAGRERDRREGRAGERGGRPTTRAQLRERARLKEAEPRLSEKELDKRISEFQDRRNLFGADGIPGQGTRGRGELTAVARAQQRRATERARIADAQEARARGISVNQLTQERTALALQQQQFALELQKAQGGGLDAAKAANLNAETQQIMAELQAGQRTLKIGETTMTFADALRAQENDPEVFGALFANALIQNGMSPDQAQQVIANAGAGVGAGGGGGGGNVGPPTLDRNFVPPDELERNQLPGTERPTGEATPAVVPGTVTEGDIATAGQTERGTSRIATGSAIGAQIGSAAGPIGATLGTAVGALIGGVLDAVHGDRNQPENNSPTQIGISSGRLSDRIDQVRQDPAALDELQQQATVMLDQLEGAKKKFIDTDSYRSFKAALQHMENGSWDEAKTALARAGDAAKADIQSNTRRSRKRNR